MEPTLFLLFNHRLTPDQAADARASLGVSSIADLPPDLKELWGSIPPRAPEIEPVLAPFRDWLDRNARPADFVLVQGDFGATYLMVRFAMARNWIPVYSASRREAVEEHLPDGRVRLTHHFRHERFRYYGR
ncbi:MAG: CRISPR-associated protein Csx20 [Thermodesulfobacteriota bacterium]|nr:CRISPR-associated protein Csx20 [Thermodesulfobacteriota bacterium]